MRPQGGPLSRLALPDDLLPRPSHQLSFGHKDHLRAAAAAVRNPLQSPDLAMRARHGRGLWKIPRASSLDRSGR